MLGTVRPMSTTSLTATASMASWAESPDHGPDAPLPRLAHAEVSFSYTGDLVAKSECNYSLSYARDGTGEATGFETITGQRDGEEGSFTCATSAASTPKGWPPTSPSCPARALGRSPISTAPVTSTSATPPRAGSGP